MNSPSLLEMINSYTLKCDDKGPAEDSVCEGSCVEWLWILRDKAHSCELWVLFLDP